MSTIIVLPPIATRGRIRNRDGSFAAFQIEERNIVASIFTKNCANFQRFQSKKHIQSLSIYQNFQNNSSRDCRRYTSDSIPATVHTSTAQTRRANAAAETDVVAGRHRTIANDSNCIYVKVIIYIYIYLLFE
jgi:hypothetical protein